MNTRFARCVFACAVAVLLSGSASAGFVYNENVDGDLSDDGFAPDVLVPSFGNNTLTGSAGGADDHDFFSITLPPAWTIESIIVNSYAPATNTTFLGVEDATVFDTSPGNLFFYGYSSFGTGNIGSDVLPAMGASNGNFTPPLAAGDYTFWINESDLPVTYSLTLVIGALPGDVNCDGEIDLFDIDPFVLALTSATNTPPYAAYYAAFPGCDPLLADLDGNGVVDLFDIDPFVAVISE